jgi:hypothetical protein
MNKASRVGEILKERGWCQWSYEDRQGRICLLHAIEEVEPGLGHLYDVFHDAIALTYPQLRGWEGKVSAFNDLDGTTLKEIGRVVRKASMLLAEEERRERNRPDSGAA